MFFCNNENANKLQPLPFRLPVQPSEASIPFLVGWHPSSCTPSSQKPPNLWPTQCTCLRSRGRQESRCHCFLFSYSSSFGAKVDLPDLSSAAVTKFPIISATSELHRLRRLQRVCKVLALGHSSFLTFWGASTKASGT